MGVLVKARDGFKFVMVLTLPDGVKCAVGEHEDMIALIPIDETGNLRGVIAWDSYDEVREWLKRFREQNGESNFKLWMSFKPEIGEVVIAH